MVQKKDKSWRMCVDYRKLNEQTIKDAYPLTRIDDNLDSLNGAEWFSSLDLDMAYHQVPLAEGDKKKTAFATPGQEWTVPVCHHAFRSMQCSRYISKNYRKSFD